MDAKQVAGAILSMIIRVCLVIVVIYFVYNVGIESYNFGYRVFADLSLDVAPGRDKEVTIVNGKSPKEIGELLEDKGVIADAKVFWVQELLSESHGKLQPGVYQLNTSMNGEQIIAVLSGQNIDSDEDASEEKDEAVPASNTGVEGEIHDNVGEEDHTSEMAPDESEAEGAGAVSGEESQ